MSLEWQSWYCDGIISKASSCSLDQHSSYRKGMGSAGKARLSRQGKNSIGKASIA
jgi:hypothetical protein